MKIKVPHLVIKPGRGGSHRYYWQPAARLRKAGWRPVRLPDGLEAAIAEAQTWNRAVGEWRQGKPVGRAGAGDAAGAGKRAAPASAIKKLVAQNSVGQLLRDFLADCERRVEWRHQLGDDGMQPRTLKQYRSAGRVIDEWAGDQQLTFITAKRCDVLLRELAKPAEGRHEPRLHRAAGIGAVLRTMLGWAKRDGRISANPMDDVIIRTPAPRHQVWEDHHIEAALAMADAMDLPMIGTAIMLAADTGQREGDLLKLSWAKLPMENGRRTIRLRQGKTGRWISVTLTERLAARLAEMELLNRASPVPKTTVLLDGEGRPWQQEYFVRTFAAVRAATIAGDAQKAMPPQPEIAGLQYRDLRRTLVVRMGEAGCEVHEIAAVTGHKINDCLKILETYLPRTGKMAAAGIAKLEAHRARQKPKKATSEQQG